VGPFGKGCGREKNSGVPLVEADGGKLDIRWLRFRFTASVAQRRAVVLAGRQNTPGTARCRHERQRGRLLR
jgi:hypothetical protein